MLFSVIGQWLLDGKSPHTNLPVTETCRIVKPNHQFNNYAGFVYTNNPFEIVHSRGFHYVYRVGLTYAIQFGRGQKAAGRTPPIAMIYRQDVREMTTEDAVCRGFVSVEAYLDVWTKMHDPTVLLLEVYTGKGDWLGALKKDWKQGVVWNPIYPKVADEWDMTSDIIRGLRTRPAEHYQAWVIRFEEKN